MLFWLLWLGMFIIFVSSFLGVYAWDGRLLEIVSVKAAKGDWVYSVLGLTLGLLLFIGVSYSIVSNPNSASQLLVVQNKTNPLFWPAIALIALGGLVLGFSTQLYQLQFEHFSKASRKKVFYIGLALLGIGLLILSILLMPGFLLPSDLYGG